MKFVTEIHSSFRKIIRHPPELLVFRSISKFALDLLLLSSVFVGRIQVIISSLLSSNRLKVVKVADFGVAKVQSQSEVITTETRTYRWMAPEVIGHREYDHKADVFSFRIVLWELLTGEIPYSHFPLSPLQAAVGVVSKALRAKIPNHTLPKLFELLERCWQQEPSLRPNFSEVLEILQKITSDIFGITDDSQPRLEGHVFPNPVDTKGYMMCVTAVLKNYASGIDGKIGFYYKESFTCGPRLFFSRGDLSASQNLSSCLSSKLEVSGCSRLFWTVQTCFSGGAYRVGNCSMALC